jgi:hypothetical protein
MIACKVSAGHGKSYNVAITSGKAKLFEDLRKIVNVKSCNLYRSSAFTLYLLLTTPSLVYCATWRCILYKHDRLATFQT